MSMLSRIDDWLIEGPYQAAVDFSQRKPEWWAQQCVIGNFVMTCILIAVGPSDQPWLNYAVVGACLVLSPIQWIGTLIPAWFACFGAARLTRLLLLGLSLPNLLGLLGTNPAIHILALLGDVALVSYCYFAACKPPRPRAPRFNLAPGGAA